MTWRVGHKLGRTLYEGDSLIGMMDTEDLARIVVDAVNARAEALVPRLRLRTRAEVDAEIVTVLRKSVGEGRSRDCFPLVLDGSPPMRVAERLIELCVEPLAPDPTPNPTRVTPPDGPPEACSCDEALTLRARVQELEAERSHLNRTTGELRARLVNIYRLTLTGGEDAVTLRAIRAASAPGAPAPPPEKASE